MWETRPRCGNVGTINDRWTNNSGKHGEDAACDDLDYEQTQSIFNTYKAVADNKKLGRSSLEFSVTDEYNNWILSCHNYKPIRNNRKLGRFDC